MVISKGVRTFNVINIIFLTVLGLTMVLPLLHVIAQSFSNSVAINKGLVYFWPVNFTGANYTSILQDKTIWIAFRNSVIITVGGTLINLAATASLAYPLSRQEYLGRKVILIMVLITLIFHAPLIPNYLLLKNIKLLNTLWVLMIPTAISAYNLFVMRSFFMNLPNELFDSARIDGCGEMGMLWRIVLPLSKPAMATMGIMYAVSNWNTYSAAIYYINSRSLIPLQVRLREMIITDQFGASDSSALDQAINLSPEGLKMAVIVIATVPIMLVYPFLQKHFIKGMLVGSIKS
ncbi:MULTISPECIES: carbohydrate ABC transporter permease [unclassified Paenibacillus]|uniref:carbohydrate ABC transporter permease n=1 Tax=unclassified Paenibacillus TaxID=185978 RepID=UPI0009AF1A7D|nr:MULTISPECIES: carbohydrate ABC transporter permease [unclassified Paenibacillus]MBE1441909.1 multiple sugar transport system permease protein/putative aldouronate transport system permease protein [Paenibacillus sp. OAS669]